MLSSVTSTGTIKSHNILSQRRRYALKKAYIVKKIKRLCQRCKYLKKETIGIIVGPASERNLKTAPTFYITQFDLTRPFKANSKHNKKTTLKIWLVVFACVTTITINIKVMEDYSTTTFFQAFTRISCEVGYPKKLSRDEGSRSSKDVHQ